MHSISWRNKTLMKTKQLKDNIRVYTRLMPMTAFEIEQGYLPLVDINHETKVVSLKSSPLDTEPRKFQFTDAFDSNATQEEIFQSAAIPLVQDFLNGYNCALFTYGHAGTGKTYTIEGDSQNCETEGIIPRVFKYIFDYICTTPNETCSLRASYLEIYAETYRDLLREENSNIDIYHTNGRTHFHGSAEYLVKSPKELRKLLRYGSSRRTQTKTNNDTTTGSHTIFKLILERQDRSVKKVKTSELSFVDLAGTDKFTEGELTPDKLRQCSKINLSLFELGNVINQIVQNSSYISYRNSKLTIALRNCLGGNAKTSIITTVNPYYTHYTETLSSFLFAARARQIVNCPVINEDPRDSLIRSLKVKIAQLRQQLLQDESRSKLTEEDKQKIDEIATQHQEVMTSLNNAKNVEDRKHEEAKVMFDTIMKQKEEIERQNAELQEKLRLLETYATTDNEGKPLSPTSEIRKVEQEIATETKMYIKESKHLQASIKKKTKDIAFLNFVISQYIPDQIDKTLPIPVSMPPPQMLPNEELMIGEYDNSIRVLRCSELLTEGSGGSGVGSSSRLTTPIKTDKRRLKPPKST
ncbi:Kinesin-like protein KIF3A [Tritrichomonas foetus]|uniref:Kinesin-like protein KIF3A n=1 Tax=Tritrichomonas foetus TaxID=1144522 RepID=A0A1J4JHB0_9EUKA|nr:Kinesin-like protein KIF3A [Tritrichomonas foetus]|eukprot:OHS97647.1 Kinesin-like protein KIF3A [Tritrichomonas foetus]